MEQQVIDSTEQEVQTADEPKTPTLKETLEAAVKGEDVLPEPPAEKMEVIANAVAAAKQKEEDQRREEAEKNRAAQKRAREQVRSRQEAAKGFRGGYGF